jgi:hypothetical protein
VDQGQDTKNVVLPPCQAPGNKQLLPRSQPFLLVSEKMYIITLLNFKNTLSFNSNYIALHTSMECMEKTQKTWRNLERSSLHINHAQLSHHNTQQHNMQQHHTQQHNMQHTSVLIKLINNMDKF